jgi:hypothetical protein
MAEIGCLVGHPPESIEEKQMRKFFSKFRNIRDILLSCFRKTDNSNGYGRLYFDTSQIAKSMYKSLLLTFVIECLIIPVARIHPMLLKKARRGHPSSSAETS